MKDHIFYGKGMGKVKREYKEIYDVIADLNEVVYTGKVLDYKTQKLIAIGITAAHCDETATEKQMRSTMKELKVTQEEIACLLYTSDAADDLLCVDLGGRRIIKKNNCHTISNTHTSHIHTTTISYI